MDAFGPAYLLKCEKCGKEIKAGLVRNKEYGWICVPCSYKLLFDRSKGDNNRVNEKKD